MLNLKSSFILGLTLLAAQTSWANLKVSLVTVSPGPVIFESFGHSAVIVEDSKTPKQAMVYEYGAVDAAALMDSSDLLAALTDLFTSKVKTKPTKESTSTDGIVPQLLRNRYLSNQDNAYREVRIDFLNFTDTQSEKFVGLLEKDLAAGEYNYDNYKANCATKIRDRLFDDSVLGKEARKQLLTEEENTSIQELTSASFDEAVALSRTKKVALFPPSYAKTFMGKIAIGFISKLGMKSEYSSSAEFQDALKVADGRLADALSDHPIADAFHNFFFGKHMTAKPMKKYDTMFLPKKLRELTAAFALDLTKTVTAVSPALPVKATPTAKLQ